MLLCSFPILAQQYSVSGYLLDAQSGEAISSGQIRIPDGIGQLSNFDGFYALSFNLEPNEQKVRLIVSALGYVSDTINYVLLRPSNRLDIKLKPFSLDEIEVKASAINLSKALSPSVERLKQVPVLLGQADLVKSLSLFPGVSSGQEGLSDIYIRGGDADQNLVLLDGSTIYNPGHLFGFLSVFNPDVVRSFELHKDFIPAKYGGRLASVLNVQTIDGNQQQRRTSKEFGLLTAAYTSQGPLRDSSWTYHLAGRLSHSAWASLASLPGYLSNKIPLIAFGTVDVNGKLVKRYEDGGKLSLSMYIGEDALGGIVKGDSTNTTGGSLTKYGNITSGLRYVKPSRSGNVSISSINFNTYHTAYGTREVVENVSTRFVNKFSNKSRIDEFSLGQQYNTHLGQNPITLGMSLSHRWIEPIRIKRQEDGVESEAARNNIRTGSAAFYIDTDWKIHRQWRIDVGLRASFYHTFNEAYTASFLTPRLALNHLLSDKAIIYAAYNRTTQDLHAVENIVAGIPNTLWLPSTIATPVATSNIFSLGYKKTFPLGQIQLGAYYKEMVNQVILPSFSFAQNTAENWENELTTNGRGYAYGLEFYYENAIHPNALLSASYTFSRSFRQFSTINEGAYFPFNFDRPHDFNVQLQLKLDEEWQLASAFYYQTGRPISSPTAIIPNELGASILYFPLLNNSRLPDYHRLDIVLSKKTTTRKGRAGKLNFGLYNVYARRNALDLSFNVSSTSSQFNGGPVIRETRLVQSKTSLFQFFPILSYEVKY